MKPIFTIRKSRSIFWVDPRSSALPPKKVLVPAQNLFFPPRSSSTSITISNLLLLFSHQAYRSLAYLMPPIAPIENP